MLFVMNNPARIKAATNRMAGMALTMALAFFPLSACAAPTRFLSPNYGVESVIFGGTGVLRNAEASIPPIITVGPAVSGITTEKALVSWQTDKPATGLVLLGTVSGTYPVQTGQAISATDTIHEVEISNLAHNTRYYFKVRSEDINGNVVESNEQSFVTEIGDVVAPRIIAGPQATVASSNTIIVTWETDEVSSTAVEYGTASPAEKSNGKVDELTTFHQIELSGLEANQRYLMRVKSRDASGNQTTSETIEATTFQSTTITDVKVSDITLNSALIQWKTTSPSDSRISYGATQERGESITDSSFSQNHIVRLSGLESGKTYYFRITGQDQSGGTLSSDEYIFKTVVLPVISDFKVSEVSSSEATLSWQSSSDIDELVRYEVISSGDAKVIGKKLTSGNDALVSQHIVRLSDLESGAGYAVTVLGKDVFGNQATSEVLHFDTTPDAEPPEILNLKSDTSVDLGSKQSVQVLVSFGLSEPGQTVLEYGLGASGAYTDTVKTDAEISQSKFLVIPGLTPGQSYHFRIVAQDRSGNKTTSADYLVLAPSQPLSLLDLIFGQVRQNFGWLANLGK